MLLIFLQEHHRWRRCSNWSGYDNATQRCWYEL